jgi:fructose-bisphosphate aldolase class I
MIAQELLDTARAMVSDDKGLLAMAFSFARAIQQPGVEIWKGKDANVLAAQQAPLHRARCNRAARRGVYTAAMEGSLA